MRIVLPPGHKDHLLSIRLSVRGQAMSKPTASSGQGAQTVIVLALFEGLAEALTQGEVALSGGAVQELFDLIGAGPHLQRVRGRTGRGLLDSGLGRL